MGTYGNEPSLLSKLISWFLVAVLAVAALKLAFWLMGTLMGLVGTVLGIGTWLLFTVGPVLLAGWLVLRIIRWLGKPAERRRV